MAIAYAGILEVFAKLSCAAMGNDFTINKYLDCETFLWVSGRKGPTVSAAVKNVVEMADDFGVRYSRCRYGIHGALSASECWWLFVGRSGSLPDCRRKGGLS